MLADEAVDTQLGFFDRVEEIGKRGVHGWIFAWLIALVVHGGGAGVAASGGFEVSRFAESVQRAVQARLNATIDVEQFEPPEPEPEPIPEAEPETEATPVEPVEPIAQPVESVSAPTEDAPPPAAAEAGQVLTSEPDPDEPLDLTGEGFITGKGTRFAGGETAADGTSNKAVRDPNAVGGGVPGSQGKTEGASGPPPIDRSQPAGLPPNANWSACPFPPEADAENVHQARVRLVVVVSPSGKPTSVTVLGDPGYGFAREARRCAMRFRYPAGLDKMGNPTTRSTQPFVVRFQR